MCLGILIPKQMRSCLKPCSQVTRERNVTVTPCSLIVLLFLYHLTDPPCGNGPLARAVASRLSLEEELLANFCFLEKGGSSEGSHRLPNLTKLLFHGCLRQPDKLLLYRYIKEDGNL